jgi:predicted permease
MSVERWILAFNLRLQSLFRRRHVEANLDEELLFHVEHLTESNIAQGMSPKEARYQALQAMEGYEQKKEECRDSRGVNWLENISRDVRYGLRMLRRSPVFTAVAVLSLALGIGANSAIFSLIDTLLLRPLPVSHPEELRNVFLKLPERPQPFVSYPMFQALQARGQAFTSLATWSNHRFQMASGGEVVHVDGELASGSYFSTLKVSPGEGRVFTEADDHPSGGKAGPVAVISDRFWDRHYQRSPSAVGSDIVLDQIRFTVIGVMPPNFFGAEMGTHPDVWIPISFADRVGLPGCISSRSCWWLTVMGRMKPGVTAAQANAHLAAISSDVLKETIPPGWSTALKTRYRAYSFLSDSGKQGWSFLRLQFSDPLLILMTLVVLVLLIACANMANLLLARASARHREIAVRLSMGAGRARIVRQLLTESVLLSLAGGLTGTLFAFWLTRILIAFVSTTQRHGPGQFTRLELQPDWRMVLFTLGVALISGILFGLTPALRATRVGIASSLKESAHHLRGSEGRFQSGRLILTFQTALSVLLVAAAGLFAGSLFRLLTLNFGFNPDNVSLIEVDTDKRPEKGPALAALYARILERANALPGVKAASLLSYVPLSRGGWDEKVRVPGKADLPGRESSTALNWIGPRFFDVMGTRLTSGRQFNEGDTAAAEKVGILSELAAQRFFPREDPIGQHIRLLDKPIRIVGVAENMKYQSLRDDEPPELYIPYTQRVDGLSSSYTFIIKTHPGTTSPDRAFRAMLHQFAPDVPIGMTYSMEQQVDGSVGRERLMASLSIFFGSLALLLTSIGLYGILAYTVTRRTGEIGIRMALGARRTNVIWLVLRGAMSYVLGGILIGAIAVLGGSRLVASLLYGIQPNDPGNLVAAVIALLFVTTLAALLPSLRASRVDPAISLRQE